MKNNKSAYKRFFSAGDPIIENASKSVTPGQIPPQQPGQIVVQINQNVLPPQVIGQTTNIEEGEQKEKEGEEGEQKGEKEEGEKEEEEGEKEEEEEEGEQEEEEEEEEEEEQEEEEEEEQEEEEEEDIPFNPILYEKAEIDKKGEQGEKKEEKEKEEEKDKEGDKEGEKKEGEKEEGEKEKEENIEIAIELLQENQHTDIYTTRTNKQYDYLIKENLSLYPGEIPKDKNVTVHLCMYSIVLDSYKPFIQYLLCLSNNIYDFPTYKPENTKGELKEQGEQGKKEEVKDEEQGKKEEVKKGEQEDEVKDEEEKWMEEFKTHFFEIFPHRIAKYFMPNMEEYYKGVIEEEFESSLEIFLFFDISTIPPQLLKENPFTKSLIPENFILSPIHEFYNLRAIGNTPINSQIEGLFFDHDYLLEIREHSSEKPVDYPYVLFLCEKESGMFGGSSYKNLIKPSGPPASYSICLPKIDHEKIGEFYFFTSKPIDTAATNLRRFAVFIDEDSTLFLDKEEGESKFENLYDEEESYSVIYMYDGETQLWVVKSLGHITEL